MKNRINIIIQSVILIITCLFSAGCDNNNSVSGQQEQTLPAFAMGTVTETAEPLEYPVYINETEIKKKPERVVSLSPSLTEIIFEMGYGEKLVGRSAYCDYPEAVSEISDVGKPSQPDIDTIIGLSPDIILTATVIPNKDIMALRNSGIETVYIAAPRSIEEMKGIYYAAALVFEGAFDAESVSEKAWKTIADRMPTEKSLGKYIYITEGMNIAGKCTLEDSVLSLYGENLAKDIYGYTFEKEFLLENEPDVIIFDSQFTIEALSSDDIIGKLAAYSSGNTISIDNSYFERPTGRITELFYSLENFNKS